MKNKLILFPVVLVFAFIGFTGCAKKGVRTDVGVGLAEKEAEAVEWGDMAIEGKEVAKPEPAPVVVEEPVREEPKEEPVVVEPVKPEPVKPTWGRVEVEGTEPIKKARVTEEVVQPMEELGDVFFDYDRYAIRTDAADALQNNARILSENTGVRITVEGHCDERGTEEYNIALGERRAMAVKNYLKDLGVDPDRVAIISYGKERPFCFDHNESCWQENRRGHIKKR